MKALLLATSILASQIVFAASPDSGNPIGTLAESKAYVVLFVIDNSTAMSRYQRRLADVIPEFVKQLPKNTKIYVTAAAPGSTTSTVSIEMRKVDSTDLIQEAIMRAQQPACTTPAFHATSCETPKPRGLIVASDVLAMLKGPVGQVDVVLLSVEDENFDGTELIPSESGDGFLAEQSLRANLQAGPEIRFNSIIVRPGDVTCLSQMNRSQADRNGFYGSNYARASELTGGRVLNICDENYRSLTDIAVSIKEIKKVKKDL